jgi:hypothetical protein
MRGLALLLLFACELRAAEDRLAAIQLLLVPMRAAPIAAAARGATPALTDVKHQLRDWIESRLTVLQWNGNRWAPNSAVLEEQLNDELVRADLVCARNPKCLENPLGYLGRVVLEMQAGFLWSARLLAFRSAAPMTQPTFTS